MDDNKMQNDDEIFAEVEEKQKIEIKRFEKFSVRDIVFLAICSAAALLFSAIMPLVAHVPVYGIIQIVVSLQTSLFFALGLYKTRKHGSLMFMAICSAIVQVFMAPVMFFMSLISAAIIELVFLIFKEGYHKNIIRWLASILYIPLQMPMLWFYYGVIINKYAEGYTGELNTSWWFILLMVLAVITLNVVGTLLGNIIGRELEKG